VPVHPLQGIIDNCHQQEMRLESLQEVSLQSQSQYSLFSLGMFTYTYEHQDIQIALKRLPGG
jgi:hypothetical protein